MSLSAFTGTVSTTQLRANFDDKTTTILANMRTGAKDQTIYVNLASMTNASAVSLRGVAFTPQDDFEVRIVMARGTADLTGRTLVASVTVDNGDTAFLVDNNIFATVTSNAAGVFDTRTLNSGNFLLSTGTKVRLNKGVRYLLSMSTDAGTWTSVQACVQLRSVRRIA